MSIIQKLQLNTIPIGESRKGALLFIDFESLDSENGQIYRVQLCDSNEFFVAYDYLPNNSKHVYPAKKEVVYVELLHKDNRTYEIINILPTSDKLLINKCNYTINDFETEPTNMKINDIRNGETQSLKLLSLKYQERTDRNGNSYIEFTLTDGEKTVQAKKFGATIFEFSDCIGENIVVDCKLKFNSPYYNIESITKSSNQDIEEFIRTTPIKVNVMYDYIVSTLKKYAKDTTNIANIGIKLFEENKEKMLKWSASKSMHHDMRGGLLYHIYRMMKAAQALTEIYQPIDCELLYTSIAIHDIGKLVELDTTDSGVASYTPDGELFGHLEIGVEMINEVASAGEYDKEKTKLLKHCIASHHGTREFGAIATPRIKEAFLLNKIDDMDAKVYMFDSIYNDLEPGKAADKAHFGLDGKIYRPEFTKDIDFTQFI